MLQKVATTGVSLDSVYDQTLQRIKEQKGGRSRLGMEVLMWVSHAERPLRIDELSHALAVEMEAMDFDPENVPPQDTVLGSCLGLAVVDRETSTVRLIHYTLQEHLSWNGVFPNAHRILGQACLTYLNYDQVKGLPADNLSTLGDMSFLEYSSFYWGSHAKIELSDQAKSLALELLNRYDHHISATLLLSRVGGRRSYPATRHLFTGLHCASYFGVAEVLVTLIEMEGCDINQRDCMGRTPLMWAAQRGNEAIVRLLLTQYDVNPDKPNNSGRTPLWCASDQGHGGVVKLLLARNDVNPSESDKCGETPLWRASFRGHEGVVRLLLTKNDVDPDKPDNSGRTPLLCASGDGNEGVVKLLLTRSDVDPDKPDNNGRTPLWQASLNGNEFVARLLLGRDDVNPDKPDNYGRTLLWWASASGKKEVVETLLTRRDVNPDRPDIIGRTPLLVASMNGHREIVGLLQLRMTEVPSVE